jgi:transcription termination/antitermination protein NusG
MTVEMHAENATHVTDHAADPSAELPPPIAGDPPPTEEPPPPIAAPEPSAVVARSEEIERQMEPETADAAEQEPPSEPPEAPAEATPEEAEQPAPTPEQPAPDEKKHWYIVKVQSGREESIKEAVERRVKIEGLEEYFGQIKIPVEKVTELRNGKRVVRSRKKFPGYLMAHVEFNDRILYLFRETSGVGDFVGATVNRAPSPMPSHEVDRMLADEAIAAGDTKGKAIEKIKLKFDKGDRVRVRDGTFQGMEGEVKEILEPKEAKDPVRVRIELTIFGRPVPVEVEAWQVDPA